MCGVTLFASVLNIVSQIHVPASLLPEINSWFKLCRMLGEHQCRCGRGWL